MNGQDPLDLQPLVIPETPPGLTIEERFIAFHEANPGVLRALENLAAHWWDATGGRPIGIAALFEQLRWLHGIRTRGDSYALNNDYRAGYARLILDRHPEWSGLFHLRHLRSA